MYTLELHMYNILDAKTLHHSCHALNTLESRQQDCLLQYYKRGQLPTATSPGEEPMHHVRRHKPVSVTQDWIL